MSENSYQIFWYLLSGVSVGQFLGVEAVEETISEQYPKDQSKISSVQKWSKNKHSIRVICMVRFPGLLQLVAVKSSSGEGTVCILKSKFNTRRLRKSIVSCWGILMIESQSEFAMERVQHFPGTALNQLREESSYRDNIGK